MDTQTAMKWNAEWVDLQNISRMIADCWRYNDKQLADYAAGLRKDQDLIFASPLGISFVGILEAMPAGNLDRDWSGLKKDVQVIQAQIKEGLSWNQAGWLAQYEKLKNKNNFRTKLGQAFLAVLRERLELDLSPDQKMFRRDLRQVREICDKFQLETEDQIQAAVRYVENGQNLRLFESWLGDGFARQLDQESKKRIKNRKKEEKARRKAEAQRKKDQQETGRDQPDLDPDQKEVLEDISLDQVFSEALEMTGPKGQTGQGAGLKKESPVREKKAKKGQGVFGKVLFAILLLFLLLVIIALLLIKKFPEKIPESLQPYVGQMTRAEEQAEEALLVGGQQLLVAVRTGCDSLKEMLSSDGLDQAAETADSIQAAVQDKLGVISQDQALAAADKSSEKKVDIQPNTGKETGKQKKSRTKIKKPEILTKYRRFAGQYPDVYGWLKIPGTEIDQPVMQCLEDDKDYFYLHHNYKGQASEAGSLFVDSKSSSYPMDQNTVIYGHNMQNGHNFGFLTNYENPDFYKDHDTIQFDTIYETGEYEIVAVAITRVMYQDEMGFRYYYLFNYNDKDTFQQCREFIEKHKLYDTGRQLKESDQTIMLSTCEYSIDNGRLVVIARRK